MTSLEEIKRLLSAATPGLLFTAWSEASETLEITSAARKGMVGIAQIETGFNADFDAEQKANAQLIVAAVNEIGGIIEQVERLQKVAYVAAGMRSAQRSYMAFKDCGDPTDTDTREMLGKFVASAADCVDQALEELK